MSEEIASIIDEPHLKENLYQMYKGSKDIAMMDESKFIGHPNYNLIIGMRHSIDFFDNEKPQYLQRWLKELKEPRNDSL